MTIYGYKCSKTNEEIERRFKLGKAESIVQCNCGEPATRLYSYGRAKFEGNGWADKKD